MAVGFYYFFEGSDFCKNGILNHDWLDKRKLRSLMDVVVVPRDAVLSPCSGPDGKPGHVLYVKPVEGGEPRDYRYNSQQQKWLQRGDFWIGWDEKNIPTAEDLQRKDTCSGYRLTDEHDNEWILPVVRSPKDRQTLPVDYLFDETGSRLLQRVKKRYERYWELAGDAVDYLMMVGEVDSQKLEEKFNELWVITTAVAFLGINYRIDIHEVTALAESGRAMIDTAFAVKVLHAATDWHTVVQMDDYLKKKAEVRGEFLTELQSQLLTAEA